MDRQGLLKALKAVSPGVSRGEALLIGADSFTFRNGYVQSYNDVLSVSYPLDAGVEATVKAVELVKVLEKMAGMVIELTIQDNALEITDGSTALSMKLIEAGTGALLDSLALGDLDWQPLPPDFTEALSLCLPSVSANVVHGALTGVRVEDGFMMSSDNFRATWVDLSEPMIQPGTAFQGFTLPGAACKDLLKLEGLEHWAATESWAHFLNSEGAVLSSRLIASEYPVEGLKKTFPEPGQESYRLPDGLDAGPARADIMAYTQDDGMDFVTLYRLATGKAVDKDVLMVKGERQCGTIKVRVKAAAPEFPKDVVINIQAKHLLDIMGKTSTFQMVGNLAYFHGEGFRHIIATILKD